MCGSPDGGGYLLNRLSYEKALPLFYKKTYAFNNILILLENSTPFKYLYQKYIVFLYEIASENKAPVMQYCRGPTVRSYLLMVMM